MHKKIKLFVSMFVMAAMLVLLPGANALNANAEGNTYSLKYFGGSINDWRYVSGGTFEDGMYHRELYTLKALDLKDGDNIVVYGGDVSPAKDLDLGNVKLNSLTVYQNARAVVITGGIKDCYVLAGAYASINGAVTNAYLYDTTTCTFNNDVLDLTLYITDRPHSDISCAGTVGCYQTVSSIGASTGVYYDIPKNTMRVEKGGIQFPYWAPAPSAAYLEAKAAGETTADSSAAPATTPAPGQKVDIKDYHLIFDAAFYSSKYPDLKAAFGDDEAALLKHFKECGMKEGRQAIAPFNVNVYKDNYKDLQNAFGDDLPRYYEHYVNCGYAEGRVAN